ncbi:hypothetical protein [Ekhidna sp.]
MKQTKTITLIFVLLFSYNLTNAQLGRALLKKSTKSKKDLELDWTVFDQDPAVTFYSLLDGTSVHTNGIGTFSYYTGTFISYLQANGEKFSAIYDEEKFMKIKFFKGDEYISTHTMSLGQGSLGDNRIQMVGPNFTGNEDAAVSVAKHGVGTYRMEFYAGTKMYYNFEFEAYKVTNDDAYAELKEMYLVRGPWNDYAYLKHNSSGNIEFGMYLTHEEFKPNPDNERDLTKYIFWYLDLFKDGKLVGTSFSVKNEENDTDNTLRSTPERMTWHRANPKRGEWNDYTSGIRLVGKSDGDNKYNALYAPFKGLEDGNYQVKVKLTTEETLRTYSFTVAGGNIVLPDYQDRAKNTDPTKLVEGWNNYIWLKLEK